MTDSLSATTPTAEAISENLQEFLLSRTKQAWEPDVDLFASGVVSSMFAMELVVYVEKTFDVMVLGEDLAVDNFRTVNKMTGLVLRLSENSGV
ncbi:acyl carrier protein [Lentzea sp.]|uniref:acyl carrier protein n=1 Tax=Lentzea sp. TaxID=56099 RepID=UPI002BEDBC51|nr:acyl carrier protein [Lentzea sp.]HUQ54770.1 acyl carrier protein [Lentzea sp.]